jgi:peptidoglycan/xylan/chitin deacetylase (PgdA/CDA1 family)
VSLKVLVKTALAEVVCRTGADRLLRARPRAEAGPLVLGYHQVVEDCGRAGAAIPAMLVSTRTLERQLDCVGRRFRFVSLDELGEHLESGRPAGRPVAAVTFDDGYGDVYEHAFPLLRRKGIPAAVFVVTDLIGTSRLQRHDRLHLAVARVLRDADGGRRLLGLLAETGHQRAVREAVAAALPAGAFATVRALIPSLPAGELESVLEALGRGSATDVDHPELWPLTWEKVTEMAAAGITFGSHTRRHALLTRESREGAREELRGSREALEKRLGSPVRHFVYPDGAFDDAVVEEVAAAGYRYAYTTCGHRDRRHPLLTVPRRVLWENSSRGRAGGFSTAVMQCEAGGVFDLAHRCRQLHRRAEAFA